MIVNSYNTANTFCGISEIKLFKNESLGLNSFEKKLNDSKLIIHPNPSKGIVNIEKVANPKLILVYDLIGRKVFSQKFSTKIDFSFLPKGTYIVKTDLNQVAKLIIK